VNADERRARAARVRELLDDADVKDALAGIEADLVGEWKRSQTTEERENCWRALNIMERLRTYLTSCASSDLTALRRAK
jgi:hypothetical protein